MPKTGAVTVTSAARAAGTARHISSGVLPFTLLVLKVETDSVDVFLMLD
jgi:hypothetical protein